MIKLFGFRGVNSVGAERGVCPLYFNSDLPPIGEWEDGLKINASAPAKINPVHASQFIEPFCFEISKI